MAARSNNGQNQNKLAIWNFIPAIIEPVPELFISNMHFKFEQDTWEICKVITSTIN